MRAVQGPRSDPLEKKLYALCRPRSDLLSQALRHSTIGAKAFDGRVRDGIGSGHLAKATRPTKRIKLKQKVFCMIPPEASIDK